MGAILTDEDQDRDGLSPKGLKAAVESIRRGDPPGLAARQLPLIPVAGDEDQAPAEDWGLLAEETEGRGPGRPPGSRNRSTEEWRTYILARYRSPLVALAETYSRPVQVLAAELGCSVAAAFQIQQRAAVEALPYLHQKQPTAIEAVGDDHLPFLLLVSPGQAAQAKETGFIDLTAEIVEDQGVSEADEAKSDGPQSDGPPQPVDPQGESDDEAAD